MNLLEFQYWCNGKQEELQRILIAASESYVEEFSGNRFWNYDFCKSAQEMNHLKNGRDLCYDRVSTPVHYSLIYQMKRINLYLNPLYNLIHEYGEEEKIDILDLGAGTGAVLWAVGLIVEFRKQNGLPLPKIRVINIDSSYVMIHYNQNHLWKEFLRSFPSADSLTDDSCFQVNSWQNFQDQLGYNLWVVASYLFDYSDRVGENTEFIQTEMDRILERYKPQYFLLYTSRGKLDIFHALKDTFVNREYKERIREETSGYAFGTAETARPIWEYLKKLYPRFGITGLPPKPNFGDGYCASQLMKRNVHSEELFPSLVLHTEPNVRIEELRLSGPQLEATKYTKRPVIIVGPPGSGKSVILAYKVYYLVEELRKKGKLHETRILITSFNKGLTEKIYIWLCELLQPFSLKSEGGKKTNYRHWFRIPGQKDPVIEIKHFDILPLDFYPKAVRLESVNRKKKLIFDSQILEILQKIIDGFVLEEKINPLDSNNAAVLSPQFLLDEFRKVIYGLGYNSEKLYLTKERIGRGNRIRLDRNSEKRKWVWKLWIRFLGMMESENLESFFLRRRDLLNHIKQSEYYQYFDHVFVDEFQDCTKADMQIFFSLLKDVSGLTLAGDLGQSVHLGQSLYLPTVPENNKRYFKKYRVIYSYRVPFRISQCVELLSRDISTSFVQRKGFSPDTLQPYKGGPPGTRPIVLFFRNKDELAEKLTEFQKSYQKIYGWKNKILVMEEFETKKMNHLNKGDCMNTANAKSENNQSMDRLSNLAFVEISTILKTKGLEREVVAWDTRAPMPNPTEIRECVYTILTRAIRILLILISPDTREEFKEILLSISQKTDENFYHFWDAQSEMEWAKITSPPMIDPGF